MTRKSSSAAVLSDSAEAALKALGHNLLIAIKRRRMRRKEVAERALISQPTLRAVLRGDPATGIGAYLAVLAVLGLEEQLAAVADPASDSVGQALELRHLPERVKLRSSKYDF